jgi:hypothetical protein
MAASLHAHRCSAYLVVIALFLPHLNAKPLTFQSEKTTTTHHVWAEAARSATNKILKAGNLREHPDSNDNVKYSFQHSNVMPDSVLHFESSVSQTVPARAMTEVDKDLHSNFLLRLFRHRGWGFNLKALTCSVCKAVVAFVQVAFTSGWSEAKIEQEALQVCLFLGLEDERVCTGIVALFKVLVHFIYINFIYLF